jgi:cell division septal protein FtsQ
MWPFTKTKNRRLNPTRVLDVQLRSSRVRAARLRMATLATAIFLTLGLGLYLLGLTGQWALNRFVYENPSFAIQNIEVFTDGVISADQLRRWSGVKPGDNLLALDLSRVKRNLEMVAVIKSSSVERILPATLRIRVTEREPVAQINVPHPRPGGGIELVVFQIDADGCVMIPLDPRQRSVPLQADDSLPVLSGISLGDLQPGRKIETRQTQAALRLLAAFQSSPMASLVELKRIDIASRDVIEITTGQGSDITFAPDNFDQQLVRWQAVHEWGLKANKVIATLDLAIPNNVPARWLEASTVPPPAGRPLKPLRARKSNV